MSYLNSRNNYARIAGDAGACDDRPVDAGATRMMDPKQMTDKQLVDEWDKVEDGENLTDFEQAVLDEIERRNIDL
ncbi:hypothetical protein [Novosphingobium resinovorum]|nr:hypothetical protein [Novosphingobium resinovorum]